MHSDDNRDISSHNRFLSPNFHLVRTRLHQLKFFFRENFLFKLENTNNVFPSARVVRRSTFDVRRSYVRLSLVSVSYSRRGNAATEFSSSEEIKNHAQSRATQEVRRQIRQSRPGFFSFCLVLVLPSCGGQ